MRTPTAIKRHCSGLRAPGALALAIGAGALALAGPAAASFGIERLESSIVNQDGSPATQAGSHPYAMTTAFLLNHHEATPEQRAGSESIVPDGEAKDVEVNLPAGLVPSPDATLAKCSESQLTSEARTCPDASQVGVATLDLGLFSGVEGHAAVYNMVPPPGVPGELGFKVLGVIVHLIARPRSGGDYGLSANIADIIQKLVYGSSLTLWGDPSDASHDPERGECSEPGHCAPGGYAVERTHKPFLTLPTSCSGQSLLTSASMDSWQEPGNFVSASAFAPAVTGCERLAFDPSITVQPVTAVAGAPSGLHVDLRLPQSEIVAGLAEADLRKMLITLPVGMSISPSAAGGLGACTPAQIGLHDASQPTCPGSSRVGSVEIVTPLLERPLTGSVYVAQQGQNPFGSLLALYLVAEGSGALVKLAGEVSLAPLTGQVTASFDETPQLPFSEVKLDINGGSRAALVNPGACGGYTVASQLTPWSAPQSGPPAEPSSAFEVTQGCGGGGFAPSFTAGTTNNQAGAFSPFTLTFSRQDREQGLSGVTVTTPPGLLGLLKSVERCGEPQAAQGTCGAGSLIGHTTATAGAGPDPVGVTGQVFLTGSYKGAPFGLSIVVPAVAGPFNLGNVVVRAAVNVDPRTARITVASDPLPTILQGIPLQLKTVNVAIDRQGFMFNPTSCDPQTVAGSIASTQGATASVSSRFQAANCAGLPFKPVFTVSTQAVTSKKNGASLDVKTSYPAGSANIRSVAVTLPKQLPSRLSTIQQACPQATFNQNPAGCPAGSVIGTGTATTPVLANPLTGPAFLVSHGGAAFPDLVVILQGEGVTVELVGSINIKHGVTSSTFANVPDAPISGFELRLPEGSHSGLAAVLPAIAGGNLCGSSLTMPTTITGQNGAQVKQATKIKVTGCPAAKKKPKANKHRKGKKR